MASSTSSTSTTKNNNYNYFNNRLQNHWMFLKTRHLNWIWLPLSDRSSAIGKTENNIMMNPFLLHLFAKPFSISLGSRLYPLPFDLYISLSPSVFASFIPPTNCTAYLFLDFPAKNKSSSIYIVALLDYYLIEAFVKDAPRCSATPQNFLVAWWMVKREDDETLLSFSFIATHSRGWSVKVYLPFNPLIFSKASLSLVLISTSFVLGFCIRRSVKPVSASSRVFVEFSRIYV